MNKYKTIYMVSYYEGEPKAAISKTTGTFTIWEDRITLDKVLGSSLGNLSIGGMMIARKKAIKEGKTMTFAFDDIKNARISKYFGFQPMLILDMKDGKTLSFVGVFKADDTLTLLRKLMADRERECAVIENRTQAPLRITAPGNACRYLTEIGEKKTADKNGAPGQAGRKTCRYCGHVYGDGEVFCAECGGAETAAG